MNRLMLKAAIAFGALTIGATAFAALYGHVWAPDNLGNIACFASNATGDVAVGSVSVPPEFCQYSYAWGRDVNGNIACYPISVHGQFLPQAVPAPASSCAKAYVFARDVNGVVRCFGQGADGNVLPNSFSVDPIYCNNN